MIAPKGTTRAHKRTKHGVHHYRRQGVPVPLHVARGEKGRARLPRGGGHPRGSRRRTRDPRSSSPLAPKRHSRLASSPPRPFDEGPKRLLLLDCAHQPLHRRCRVLLQPSSSLLCVHPTERVVAGMRRAARHRWNAGTPPTLALHRRRRQTRSVPDEEAKKSRETRPALCPPAFQRFAQRNALGACAEGC